MRQWKHRLRKLDEVNRRALCATCGPVDIVWTSNGRWRCRKGKNAYDLASWHKKHPRKPRKPIQPRKRGTRFSRLRGETCEICGRTEKLCGDHNHNTDKFRGTLCTTCNTGLGMFHDKPELLEKAIKYLKEKEPSA